MALLSMQELKNAHYHIDLDKSPRPDELNPTFFKKF